ncbi:hypothetical protein KC19_VG286300 [Ceratodon purpureus]|uniref:Uncharacterized protein n=1 Tax=Ceratodon purpureus TaxID=3225 RepID=A0A8T0HUK4_CERPU|nr:hypothetical protein KC19_VG286300 [Ceratodon purpureus]
MRSDGAMKVGVQNLVALGGCGAVMPPCRPLAEATVRVQNRDFKGGVEKESTRPCNEPVPVQCEHSPSSILAGKRFGRENDRDDMTDMNSIWGKTKGLKLLTELEEPHSLK